MSNRNADRTITQGLRPPPAESVEPEEGAIPHPPQVLPPAAFWRPEHATADPFLEQIPCAFWIVERLRPGTVVTIGLGAENAHSAFAEAAERLGLATLCHAIDTAPVETPRAWGKTRGRISTADPAAEAARFAPGEIDLLLLDLDPDASPLMHIEQAWRDRLSPRAVLLVHGSEERFGATESAAFLAGLRARHPSITFAHGAGLALFLTGSTPKPGLARLTALSPAHPELTALQTMFARLGEALRHDEQLRARTAENAALHSRLAETDAALAATETARAALETDLARHREALAARSRQAAEAQALVLDRNEALRVRNAEIEALAREAAATQAALETENRALAAANRTRFEELATLTLMLEHARGERDDLSRHDASGSPAHDARPANAAMTGPALLGYVRDLERRHGAVLESNSWRALEPLRRIARLLRRRSPPQVFMPRLQAIGPADGNTALLEALTEAPGRGGRRGDAASMLLAYGQDLERRHRDLLESNSWRALEPLRRMSQKIHGRKKQRPFMPRLQGNHATETGTVGAARR